MDHRRRIQEFLTSRRARISLEAVGLPAAGRQRRVPGLRREEVAGPAGVSADCCTRLDPVERAHLFDPTLDVVALNDLGRALYGDLDRHPHRAGSLARCTFLDPRARESWVDWEEVADDVVGHLQAAAGSDPHDPALTQLVGELSTRSEDFRRSWARHDVRAHPRGTKRVRHPVVGALDPHDEVMHLGAEPGLTVVAHTAEPGTPSHDAALDDLVTTGG